jgi:hypothetical protein
MKKQCGCGEPIRLTSRWNGLSHVNVFQNMKGEEISSCPGCDEFLMTKDSDKLKEFTPCELTSCKSGQGANFNVYEADGDDLLPKDICGECAMALELDDDDVLPEPKTINDVLSRHYIGREGHRKKIQQTESMKRIRPM